MAVHPRIRVSSLRSLVVTVVVLGLPLLGILTPLSAQQPSPEQIQLPPQTVAIDSESKFPAFYTGLNKNEKITGIVKKTDGLIPERYVDEVIFTEETPGLDELASIFQWSPETHEHGRSVAGLEFDRYSTLFLNYQCAGSRQSFRRSVMSQLP